jgi:hypothetical protein
MNKYADHIRGTKDVVIEDKQVGKKTPVHMAVLDYVYMRFLLIIYYY